MEGETEGGKRLSELSGVVEGTELEGKGKEGRTVSEG